MCGVCARESARERAPLWEACGVRERTFQERHKNRDTLVCLCFVSVVRQRCPSALASAFGPFGRRALVSGRPYGGSWGGIGTSVG